MSSSDRTDLEFGRIPADRFPIDSPVRRCIHFYENDAHYDHDDVCPQFTSWRSARERLAAVEAERDRLLADQQQLRDAVQAFNDELEEWAADRHGDEEPCDDVCRALAGFADRLASVSIPDTDKGEQR